MLRPSSLTTITTPQRQNETLLPPSPPSPSLPPLPLLEDCGEGMEWHSDGAEGEFTVLFSLDDITDNQVRLRPYQSLIVNQSNNLILDNNHP